MKVTCIDAGNEKGTGVGLLTLGKEYHALLSDGGYYTILCDDGKYRTKSRDRFKRVRGTHESINL